QSDCRVTLMSLLLPAAVALHCLLAVPPDETDAGAVAAATESAPADEADSDQGGPDVRYTRDLSDAELQRRWQEDLASLGTISVGFADEGRMINAAQMPDDPAWVRQRPDLAW